MKNLLKRLSDNYVDFFKNYLLTNIMIIISTIISIILIDETAGFELFKYEIFFCINSFTIENFFKNKTSRTIGYVIAYIVAFICGYLFNSYEESFANFFLFYLVSMASLNMYHIIKETKLELSEYFHQIFSNLVSTTIINIVLTIGVLAILGIITSLLLPNINDDIFGRTIIAILGFYTIPAYLYAFLNMKTPISELANVLIKYVITPLTFIALSVVYLYLFKIIITWDMPSNMCFAIILALFIETIPVFVLLKDLKIKNKIINFVEKNISYIFLPLYILQAYSIIIRVNTYGLTEERYIGLMLIIIELIILFLMKYKERKYLIYVFFVFIIASAITFILPKVNYEDLSITYHVNRIEKIMNNKEFNKLDGDETSKVIASYEYLKERKSLNKLTVKLNEQEVLIPHNKGYFYKTYNSRKEVIDISKYKELKTLSSYSSEITNGIFYLDNYKIDLNDAINKLVKDEEIEELIYKLDDKNDFYVNYLTCDGENNEATYCTIDGYYLTK